MEEGDGAPPERGRAGGPSATPLALITATVVVDALAPLLQERASKRAGFEGSSMVLAETSSYYMGGLLLAIAGMGIGGVKRCMRPARYLAFLPAAIAFSTSNFLTYIAVRGLGASQFYLLAQLRVALLAVFLRVWTGKRQPPLAWLALVQLACGMVVLVWYKASSASEASSAMREAAALQPSGTGGAAARAVALEATTIAVEHAEFIAGMAALVGVVLSSAFGFLYLEWQLKLHCQDPLFVQLHQMNSFGVLVSLAVYLDLFGEEAGKTAGLPVMFAGNSSAVGSQLAAASGMLENATGTRWDAALLPPPALHDGSSQLLATLACIVARGVLGGGVLKQLDSIAKGLIDVTAIVLCTGIQMAVEGQTADGTAIGIQVLMLFSIVSYVVARASSTVGSPSKSSVIELPEAVLARSAPKIL